ncbi:MULTISPECIES: hypothetical protein [unclassified Rhodococcus (in: high G+C Gram-positive bacteria)]|nr:MULTISPECIES: hypothetical protein [unclassified Rhodococcus (in: high G+C Gram-positive bacteria)]
MDRAGVLPRRMRSQHLWGAPLRTAPEALGAMVAVQAQEYAYAK